MVALLVGCVKALRHVGICPGSAECPAVDLIVVHRTAIRILTGAITAAW